jgi:hypothetical protein
LFGSYETALPYRIAFSHSWKELNISTPMVGFDFAAKAGTKKEEKKEKEKNGLFSLKVSKKEKMNKYLYKASLF